MTAPLRPMNLGQLLDRSFFLYRQHFVLFFGIAALPHLALLAFRLLEVVADPLPRKALASFGWALAVLPLSFAVVAISQGGTVVAVSRVHLGYETSVSAAFAPIRHRIVSLSWIMIVVGIGVVIGLVCIIVPGIILAVMWSLVVPVAVLEGAGLGKAISRSVDLTRGSGGEIFVIYILVVVLTYAVSMVLNGPVMLAMGIFPFLHRVPSTPIWSQIALPITSFLTQCLAGPLTSITFALIYYNQRVKKEAFDLQHMMATLDSAQGGTPTPAPV